MKPINSVDFFNLNPPDKVECLDAMVRVMESGKFILGSEVATFENSLAAYLGLPFALGVANGTDALEIAIEALELPPGSEILVPSNTFISTVSAVIRAGHVPVLLDNDPYTYNITAEAVQSAITSETKAVIAVHLFGFPADIEQISSLCRVSGMYLIEDCAQAFGASINGKKLGTFGDIATFSFHPTKGFGAFGDAGAIATDDVYLYEKCDTIAKIGLVDRDHAVTWGRNSRLDAIQAAVLSTRLKTADENIKKRELLAHCYIEALSDCPHVVLANFNSSVARGYVAPAYTYFVIRTRYRDELKNYLFMRGIETLVHYPRAVHMKLVGKKLRTDGALLNATTFSDTCLSLPVHQCHTINEVRHVADKINKYMRDK